MNGGSGWRRRGSGRDTYTDRYLSGKSKYAPLPHIVSFVAKTIDLHETFIVTFIRNRDSIVIVHGLSVTANTTFLSQQVTYESCIITTRRMYIDGQITKRSLSALIICVHDGTPFFVRMHFCQ